MRFNYVLERMIADIEAQGCQLRLASLVSLLRLSMNTSLDQSGQLVLIGFAAGRMYDYFGEDTLPKYMDLYFTANRIADPNHAEILSRSHIHAD